MTYAHKNADRFKGFANLYDNTRPVCPEYVVNILTRYIGQNPKTVVDMGCGTGLSTLVWKDTANKIIGVEPNEDMRTKAITNANEHKNIEFINAFSDNTGLGENIADIVTCSQSFHWMEPVSTLREIYRVLKPGGVFAAYDCDWPPVCGSAAVELAYSLLNEKENEIESANPEYKNSFIQYPKNKHLENIRNSDYFEYAREIVFFNTENCNADRYIKIALSQGGIQNILNKNPEFIEEELNTFKVVVDKYFGDKVLQIDFCYRMRIGLLRK